MAAESQAKVISWRAKWSGVRALPWGSVGRKGKAGKESQGKTSGKRDLWLLQLPREGRDMRGWDAMLAGSRLPWAQPPLSVSGGAPTASWQGRQQGCCRFPALSSRLLPLFEPKGGWHGSCGLCNTGEKGKKRKPQNCIDMDSCTEAFASAWLQGKSGGQVMNVLIKMLVVLTVQLTFFKKVMYRWAMWLVPYWCLPVQTANRGGKRDVFRNKDFCSPFHLKRLQSRS